MKLANENPFPNQNLHVHWQDKEQTSFLWDDDVKVGSVVPIFGSGWKVVPYWGNLPQDLFDTREEAKSYLLTIYRLEH